jgi:hypothetical protein
MSMFKCFAEVLALYMLLRLIFVRKVRGSCIIMEKCPQWVWKCSNLLDIYTPTHNTSSSPSRRVKFWSHCNNSKAGEETGSEDFELAPKFKENLSCPSTDMNIKKHMEKDRCIRTWMLQVSIPSCDRSVFSTELIYMNCDATVTEVTSHGLDDKGSVSSGSRDLSLCHYIQTSRGSHSSSYPMVRYHGFLSLE